MPVILDYNQAAIKALYQFQSQLLKTKSEKKEATNIIRHCILSSLKNYKKQHCGKYGDLILACDGKNYWRKEMFPFYKAKRAGNRASSPLDWGLIFDIMSQVRQEIAEVLPYKVLWKDNLEGDDIIATLCKWYQTNDAIDFGMFEEKQPVVVVSRDGDFNQLHKYDNVKQWDLFTNKWMVCKDPAAYLAEHIAKGDSGDGVPNVLSDDDTFVCIDKRQGKMTKSILGRFIKDGRDACQNETQTKNWDRNNSLINLDMIPDTIQNQIIDLYINIKPNKDKMVLYNYLVKNRCGLLLNDIESF